MKRYLLFCQLALLAAFSAKAQFTAGNDGFFISNSTDVYINGLTMNPTVPLTLGNTTQDIVETAVPGSPPSISRVYMFNNSFDFTGRLGLFYEDTELNGNTESILQVNFGNPAYTSATTSVVDPVLHYIYNDFPSQITFSRVTAATATALPVSLISFAARKEGKTALLTWKTSWETNSDFFEIQRSSDARNWASLDRVSAAKESTMSRSYSYSDSRPLAGENLYRLKMVDLDGSFAYSAIKSVRMDALADISIYPNPVADKLTVNAENWNEIQAVKLLNVQGKVLMEAPDQKMAKEIDIKNYPSGMYLLEVLHSNGNTQTIKVVKK